MLKYRSYLSCLTLLFMLSADASPYSDCFERAGRRYAIDPDLLMAIQDQESNGRVSAVNINKNGSRDLGLMQINDHWLPVLIKFGITSQMLLDAPCTNIFVGAWVLAHEIQRFGYNWRAVGAYNAGPGESPTKIHLRHRYAIKVYQRYQRRKMAREPISRISTRGLTGDERIDV